jgi:hypothetical protein
MEGVDGGCRLEGIGGVGGGCRWEIQYRWEGAKRLVRDYVGGVDRSML